MVKVIGIQPKKIIEAQEEEEEEEILFLENLTGNSSLKSGY